MKLESGILVGVGFWRKSIAIYDRWFDLSKSAAPHAQVIDHLLPQEVGLALEFRDFYSQVKIAYARGVGVVIVSELSFLTRS